MYEQHYNNPQRLCSPKEKIEKEQRFMKSPGMVRAQKEKKEKIEKIFMDIIPKEKKKKKRKKLK